MQRATIDDDFLLRVLPSTTRLAVSDVEVIGQLAFLTAEIDLDEDRDERRMLAGLNRNLWHAIGRPPEPIVPISPLPIDREERARWIRELVPQLTTDYARELAYIAAYLTVVIDLELAPIESELLDELQHALGIEHARAEELADTASRMLMPLDENETATAPRFADS